MLLFKFVGAVVIGKEMLTNAMHDDGRQPIAGQQKLQKKIYLLIC